jgi:hypothetical protein
MLMSAGLQQCREVQGVVLVVSAAGAFLRTFAAGRARQLDAGTEGQHPRPWSVGARLAGEGRQARPRRQRDGGRRP